MAGEVQLKLGVSLDLGYFRTEMQKAVNIVNSEFTGRLKVKFDRQILDKELNNLQRAIKRREYRVEIGGNIDSLPAKIEGIKKGLADLDGTKIGVSLTGIASLNKKEIRSLRAEIRRSILSEGGKIQVPVTAQTGTSKASSSGTFRQELSGLDIGQLKNIYAAAAEDALLSFEEGVINNKGKIITALNQAAQDAGQGFVNALQDQESKLFAAAGNYANSLLGGLKKTLKIQSPSLEMWEIGSDAGKGFEEGLLKALEIAENSAVRQTRRMLDRLARMVMMVAGISGPAIDRQLLEAKALPAINFAGTVPSRQSVPIGPSSTGRALPAARGAAGLIGAAQAPVGLLPSISGRSQIEAVVEALIAQQGPRMLPSGGGPLADTKRTHAEINKRFDQLRQRMFTVLEADVKEVAMGIRDSLDAFSFLVQALKDAETKIKNNKIDEQVDSFFRSIENALRLATARTRIETVKIQDLGARPSRGSLPPSSVAPSPLLLPGAGGTGGYFRGGRRTGGGFTPEGGFPSDGMATGPQGPKNMLSLDYYKNAFKYAEALKIAEASAKNFRASNLPLIGGLQGIAAEFGEATKQVLLYGTAYKGLAFITSLPGQILNAAKSQQQYSNAMQVATQETGTFAKEMLFVDNVQRAFGLNLETTRQGFTRLYASMAPAGFDSGSIEKLFTGISAATAALQLTPDKAERVIYAFGQMASKGQAMSEELKGQLGDVLPGALSIFAKAAGKSVKEFNKELEDGVYSGSKFRDLMTKVTDELINRFGTGAAAAGRSLQGLMNTVQGDFQRTLESFSPLANAAAQAVLQPITGSLRQLSVAAQIATGEIERIQQQTGQAQQTVSDLRVGGGTPEQIRAAEQNVAALQARYEALNEALKDPAIAKQVQDIQRLTQELAKAGTFVMNVASAIGSALSPIINVLGTNLTTVISLITSFYVGFQTARLAAMALMGVLLAYRTLSSILGFGPAALSANVLATAFNGLGIAASGAQVKVVGLRLALTALVASTVVGLVVAGITMIAGAFATMGDKAKQAAQSSRDAAQAAIEAARAGNVAGASMGVQAVLTESRKAAAARKALESIYFRSTPEQRKGAASMQISPEESIALAGSPLTSGFIQAGVSQGGARKIRVPSRQELQGIRSQFGSIAGQQAIDLREAKAAEQQAVETAKKIGLNKPTPTAAGAGTATKDEKSEKAERAKKERESQIPLLKIELASREQLLNLERDIATARLGQNDLEVIRLEGLREQLRIQAEMAKVQIEKETPQAEKLLKLKALQKESDQARLKTNLELEMRIAEVQTEISDAIIKIGTDAAKEVESRKQYQQLLQQGILPSHAKIIIETNKQLEIELKKLEKLELQLKDQISLLEAKESQTEEDKKQLKILKDRLALLRQGKQDAPSEAQGAIENKKKAEAPKTPAEVIAEGLEDAKKALAELMNIGNMVVSSAKAIGDSFGQAFKDVISGSQTAQQALASFFQRIADFFLDMVAQMISAWLQAQAIKGFQAIIGTLAGAFTGGIGAGVGGAFSTGSAFSMAPGSVPAAGAITMPIFGSANGNVLVGGFQAFANGGVVNGPTLGLVGEGRYNEAIVPLPDGRAIPVDLGGAAGNQIVSNITVNVSNGQAQSNATGANSSELGRKLEGAVKQVIIGELRPGGLLSR